MHVWSMDRRSLRVQCKTWRCKRNEYKKHKNRIFSMKQLTEIYVKLLLLFLPCFLKLE